MDLKNNPFKPQNTHARPSQPEGSVDIETLSYNELNGWFLTVKTEDGDPVRQEWLIPKNFPKLKAGLEAMAASVGEKFLTSSMSLEAYGSAAPGMARKAEVKVEVPSGKILAMSGKVADVLENLEHAIMPPPQAAEIMRGAIDAIFVHSDAAVALFVVQFRDAGLIGQTLINPAFSPTREDAARAYRSILESAATFKDKIKSRFGIDLDEAVKPGDIPADDRWIKK